MRFCANVCVCVLVLSLCLLVCLFVCILVCIVCLRVCVCVRLSTRVYIRRCGWLFLSEQISHFRTVIRSGYASRREYATPMVRIRCYATVVPRRFGCRSPSARPPSTFIHVHGVAQHGTLSSRCVRERVCGWRALTHSLTHFHILTHMHTLTLTHSHIHTFTHICTRFVCSHANPLF
jgi:hypothetical protein